MRHKKTDIRKIAGSIFAGIGLVFTLCAVWMNLNVTPDADVRFIKTVFTYLGTFILAAGLFLIWLSAREQAENLRLKKAGNYVYASVNDAYPDTRERVNGKNTWILSAVYIDDTGEEHRFEAAHFIRDPRGSMTSPFVKVYVDPDDFTKYYIDI